MRACACVLVCVLVCACVRVCMYACVHDRRNLENKFKHWRIRANSATHDSKLMKNELNVDLSYMASLNCESSKQLLIGNGRW